MTEIKTKRLLQQIDELKQQPNFEIVYCEPNGIGRHDYWIVWVHGRKGTIWEGGIYPVQVNFPNEYPLAAPTINFPKDFQHVHVYKGGVICMPLLQKQHWKPKSCLSDVIHRIQSLIHQQINKYSPANEQLFALYRKDPNEYEKKIREQAKKFQQKNNKYFQTPCMHIDVTYDD